MADERVVLRRDKDILYLELSAPPANRTNFSFFEEFGRIMPHLRERDNIRGLIIHSSGRHFSSGADIEELRHQLFHKDRRATRELLTSFINAVHDLSVLPYPVVAAIQGCCMGSGLELALACDYRIATKNAYFSMPEATLGLIPGCGGTIRLPMLTGLGKGIELILTGESFLTEDALTMGIVDYIAEKKELLSVARRMLEAFPMKRQMSPERTLTR